MAPNPEPLLPVDETRALVLRHSLRPRSVRVPLEEALGRVLSRDVRADRDVPPFDRSALDGYAIRLGDGGEEAVAGFPVVARIVAGQPWRGTLAPGTAASITTGSPVPTGTDRIVPVERSTVLESGRVHMEGDLTTGSNGISRRGEDARKGEPVLVAGIRLAAPDIAVLAGVGAAAVPVFLRPRVDVFTTGDEVVEPHERPRWHQIRDGNGPLLRTLLRASGWVESVSGRRVPDQPQRLARRIDTAKGNVLVFTGGVSMGERDFVPGALRAAGFRVQVHRIAIRPGKPFLFATRGRGAAAQVAFGLPGNPVSVLVTAWEFLLPFLRASGGAMDPGPRTERCLAAEPIERPSGLTHFVPVRTEESHRDGGRWVHPVRFHGSGDYIAMGRADGVAMLASERPAVATGDSVCVHFFGDEPVLRGLPRAESEDR